VAAGSGDAAGGGCSTFSWRNGEGGGRHRGGGGGGGGGPEEEVILLAAKTGSVGVCAPQNRGPQQAAGRDGNGGDTGFTSLKEGSLRPPGGDEFISDQGKKARRDELPDKWLIQNAKRQLIEGGRAFHLESIQTEIKRTQGSI